MDEQRSAMACAIYTRESTEEGLEQEFNTLQELLEGGAFGPLEQSQ